MPRRIPFQITRLKKFVFLLFRNKLAFTGLVMLILFVLLAAGASIWTPYVPQGEVVSGANNAPFWYPLFTGETDWSLNTEFSDLNTVSPVSITTLTESENSISFRVSGSQVSGGSAKLIVEKTLSYEYNGPPKGYSGNARITLSGLEGTVGAAVRVYVQQVGGSTYCCFWRLNNMNVSRAYSPPVSFQSDDPLHKSNLGLGSTNFSPAQIIFAEKTNYVYAFEITLPSGFAEATLTVSDFKLSLKGSVFGLLGTDDSGRDLFTQLAHGARISLIVGLLATFLGVGVGLLVGLLAGFTGGLSDEVLMRFTDMMLVLPGLPLLIVLVAVLGASTLNVIMILGLLGWMGFARVIRSQVLSLRERPFIEAAKASGAGTGYIISKHVFPNIVSLTYVNLALSVPGAIVGEAALSFLGLGASGVTWGKMLEGARNAGIGAGNLMWWWIIPPGVSIALLSLSFILIGYALDEIFNPRLRRRR